MNVTCYHPKCPLCSARTSTQRVPPPRPDPPQGNGSSPPGE
jgi:hypothetical protein